MTDVMAPPGGGDGDGTGEDTAVLGGSIEPIDIQEEMERSFLDYAMSVIVSRALPDARDGLKPVHRRILYGMYDIGARSDRPHMKCARVTGDVMGKFHPHGPSAIYDALARMAQDFSLRHPLVDGHGNFGSPDHPAAAERYCVVGETRVRTAEGSPRIEELAPLLPDSETDLDRKVVDHRGDLVRASKLFHSGDHPTLRLATREGYELTGTHNHPVLCLDRVAGVPMLMWHRLDEIQPGMHVVLDRRPDESELGLDEPAWRIADAVSNESSVPDFIWESGFAVKRAFLSMLFAEDLNGPFSTLSEAKAKEVQRLLLEVGVVSRRTVDVAKGEHEVVPFSVRTKRHVASGVPRTGVPFVAEYLADSADQTDAEVRAVIEPLVDPGLYFAEVVSVEDAGVQAVYSVRVESEHHAFVSDGFVSHNTECRLALLANQMLAGIDEDTVDFADNYSGEMQEPVVLPARFPNLLVNGSQGIAVGMATNIPPHNLGEVIDATNHLLDNPEASADDLMAFIKGPDFPTGGLILGRQGILDYCRTGRGSVKMRARAEIEENKRGTYIVVTELPYQASPSGILTKVADLVTARELEGIADVNDESAGDKTRLVVKLKRDANASVVLNNLYKHTALQTSFGVNMVALVDGVPRTLNIAQALSAYVDHQVEVIRRRSEHRLAKAEARAHIVEGLLKALDMIDRIIELIRGSADRPAARDGLMGEGFEFTEIQANHILDMTLGKLTRLGRSDLESEMAELRETIADLRAILDDEARLRGVIKTEMADVREKFATPRRAEITFDPGDLGTEDLIDDEPLVFTMTKAGYVKTTAAGNFRTQGRGGRGVQGAKLKEEDLVTQIVHTTAHAYLLFFSNRGRVFRLKAHEIPMKERAARGTAIVNLLSLANDEKIQAVIDTRAYDGEQFLFFATKKGQVKKTVFSEYDKSRREGFIAINLKAGDELVKVIRTGGQDDVFMVSRNGVTIRFAETDVRAMGRDAAGVRGMKMREGDEVVSCDVARDDVAILIVTDAGYGKRTQLDKFNRQTRGGQGVRGIKLTARKGYVVAAFMVALDDEIFLISSSGVAMRIPVRDISSQGRDATGVRVMNVDAGATVASVAPILASSDDEE